MHYILIWSATWRQIIAKTAPLQNVTERKRNLDHSQNGSFFEAKTVLQAMKLNWEVHI